MPILGIFHGHSASWRLKNSTRREHFVVETCTYGGDSMSMKREKIKEHANIEMRCVSGIGLEKKGVEFGDRRVACR